MTLVTPVKQQVVGGTLVVGEVVSQGEAINSQGTLQAVPTDRPNEQQGAPLAGSGVYPWERAQPTSLGGTVLAKLLPDANPIQSQVPVTSVSDLEWFASNPQELRKYNGVFVAILNHAVVASGTTYAEAVELARKQSPTSDPLIIYVNRDEWFG